MQYSKLVWRDGQPYSEMFDDIYYSTNESECISGEQEFQHVFFRNNGLPERWQGVDNFVIAELGFGSGLNCVLTIREWLKHLSQGEPDIQANKQLHYIAIEKYPLSPASILKLLSVDNDLSELVSEIVDNYPPAIEGWHRRSLFSNRVVIHYKFMDVLDALKDERLNIDAWYLDGFSPAKNSDMWSSPLFKKIAQNSNDEATCSTYTSAGFVKRNLQDAGFTVKKIDGFGRKRDMLVARYDVMHKSGVKFTECPWYQPSYKKHMSHKNATIIGAGIAGLSTAYSLVKRGWSVTIIDKHGDVAKEASSNPAAVIYPRLSSNNDIDTDFYMTAFNHCVHTLNVLQKNHEQQFWFDDGVLQLQDKQRALAIQKKYQFDENYISIIKGDAAAGFAIDGSDEAVLILYGQAGYVTPEILCHVLQKECGDKLTLLAADIDNIEYKEKRWQCRQASRLVVESAVLIIANGVGLNKLGLQQAFPVESIKGQVLALKANKKSSVINKVINAHHYITPACAGKHHVGATYNRDDDSFVITEDNNHALYKWVNKLYPNLFSRNDCGESWVGFRSMSNDRCPIVGEMPDINFFNAEYADICHGKKNKEYRSARYYNDLYITAAHGSRGFTSGFLSAEIIAAQVTGSPAPVSRRVLNYLNPSRFIVNDLKRR